MVLGSTGEVVGELNDLGVLERFVVWAVGAVACGVGMDFESTIIGIWKASDAIGKGLNHIAILFLSGR